MGVTFFPVWGLRSLGRVFLGIQQVY
jgi:hypothetical protein